MTTHGGKRDNTKRRPDDQRGGMRSRHRLVTRITLDQDVAELLRKRLEQEGNAPTKAKVAEEVNYILYGFLNGHFHRRADDAH